MTGRKIYPKRSRLIFFLVMYAVLAAAGGIIAFDAVRKGGGLPNAAGFMIVFGSGMFVLSLIKGLRPQILVHQDFVEVRQTKKPLLLRYRNITAVSQPDRMRLLVRLWEDGLRKEEAIWLKELDPKDVAELAAFLGSKGLRSREKEHGDA